VLCFWTCNVLKNATKLPWSKPHVQNFKFPKRKASANVWVPHGSLFWVTCLPMFGLFWATWPILSTHGMPKIYYLIVSLFSNKLARFDLTYYSNLPLNLLHTYTYINYLFWNNKSTSTHNALIHTHTFSQPKMLIFAWSLKKYKKNTMYHDRI